MTLKTDAPLACKMQRGSVETALPAQTEGNIAFLILNPDKSVALLKNTVNSIITNIGQVEILGVTGGDITPTETRVFKEICPMAKGKDTLTSLINTGMKKLKSDWVLILYAGSRIKHNCLRKVQRFAATDKDICFPIVSFEGERNLNFVEASSNGILINRKNFEKIGDFPDAKSKVKEVNDFELAKMLWAAEAIEQGCQFKGIVGFNLS